MEISLKKKVLKYVFRIVLLLAIVLGVCTTKANATNELTSSTYSIEDKIISNIGSKTEISSFITKFSVESGNIHIYTDSTCATEVTSGYVSTGMALKYEGSTEIYTLSILGDVNGDGKIDQIDLTQVIKHAIQIRGKTLEGAKLVSADINRDGKVNAIDLTALIRFILANNNTEPVVTIPSAIGKITITPSSTTWTNQDIIVTLATTNTDTSLKMQYSENGINWSNYTSPITVSSNKTIYARFSNGTKAGEATSLIIDKIDKTLPTATLTTTANTTAISTNVVAQDGESGVNEYKYYIGTSTTNYALKNTSSTATYTFSGLTRNTTYYIKVEVSDNAGNKVIKETTIKTPAVPNAEGAITMTPSLTTWTNQDVTITLTAPSMETGLSIAYSENGTTWKEYTNPIVVSENKTIYACFTDGTLYGTPVELVITNIDKIAPSGNVQTTSTSKTITATATVTDPLSGIANYKFYIGTSAADYTLKDTNTTGTYIFTGLTSQTEYFIKVEVIDNAGNINERKTSKTTLQDVTTIEPNFTFTSSVTDWTKDNITLTIATPVTEFDVQYKIGSTWENYTGPITISDNGTVYARLYDGTTGGIEKSTTISNIDKVSPIVTNFKSTGVTKNSIDVSVDIVDNDSGFVKIEWYYKTGTGSYSSVSSTFSSTTTQETKSKTITGLTAGTTYTLYARVYDRAGNYVDTSTVSTTTSTDVAPATYTVSYDANGGTGAPASQIKTENVDLTLSTVEPTYTDHTFLGWATSSSATNATYCPGDTYTANATVTLYAVWQDNSSGGGGTGGGTGGDPVTNGVVSIGTNQYATLAAAVTAATSNSTINVLEDITESVEIASGKTIVLDLSGNNIKGYIKNSGTLSIKSTGEDGQIEAADECAIENYGTLTLVSGIIYGNEGYAIYNKSEGEVTISGGSVWGKNTAKNTIYNEGKCTISGGLVSYYSTNSTYATINNSGTLTMNSGTIGGGKAYAIVNNEGATATLKGGTVDGLATATCVLYNQGECEVSGATIVANSTSNEKAAVYNGDTGSVYMDSGEIDGGAAFALYNVGQWTGERDEAGYAISIVGGTLHSTGTKGPVILNEGAIKIAGTAQVKETANGVAPTIETTFNLTVTENCIIDGNCGTAVLQSSGLFRGNGGTIQSKANIEGEYTFVNVYDESETVVSLLQGVKIMATASNSNPAFYNSACVRMTDGTITSSSTSNAAVYNEYLFQMYGRHDYWWKGKCL